VTKNLVNSRKIFIETLGCQMNVSDPELMLGLMEKEAPPLIFFI
jgi:tRNA A37 methylthiotransferase MiaB